MTGRHAPSDPGRRRLLTAAVIVGAGAGMLSLPRLFGSPDALDTAAIDGLAPFRRLMREGEVSTAGGGATSAVLIGLDAGGASADPALRAAVRADPCGVLFRGADRTGALPIAYFSDVRCPWCRIMEARLAALVAEPGGGLALVEHELPVFGPASESAARAILAAGDAAGPLRDRLRHAPGLTDAAYIRHVADRLGLDAQALAARAGSASVTRRLAESRAAASLLGLVGTPGLVIGRTVVSGTVSADTLARIVAAERARGGPVCAAAAGPPRADP